MPNSLKSAKPEPGLPHEAVPQGRRFPELSPEEWTLFCHVAHGYTIKRAAKEMGVLPYRGDILKASLMQHAGFANLADLVRTAIDNGVVVLPTGKELEDVGSRYDRLPPYMKQIMHRIVGGETEAQIASTYSPDGRPRSANFVETATRKIKLRMNTPTKAELIRAYVTLEREHTPQGMLASLITGPQESAGESFTEKTSERSGPGTER